MGFELDKNLISFDARRLNTPAVVFRNSKTVTDYDASWSLYSHKFIHSPPQKGVRFANYDVNGQGDLPVLAEFGQLFMKELNSRWTWNSGNSRIVTDWNDFTTCLQMSTNSDCNIVVMQEKDTAKYTQVKQEGDLTYGKHTVCVTYPLCREPPKQFLTNLALKVNMKLGGNNWRLDNVATYFPGRHDETIILGADVTHPAFGLPLGSPSVACVVGSLDSSFMNYPGSMRLQPGRQEMIENMEDMVQERLEAYREKNGKYPTRMIFYRDGISESQYAECQRLEIKAVLQAYKNLTKADLKLTFLVVGKRHHTRFFPLTTNDAVVKNGNCRPGLLVDNYVTDPGYKNFYLQSHNGIKGTARSAHYHMLHNDVTWGTDQLENLTHHLCYSFARATKGVSYAAPAYIADQLCERGRLYLKGFTGAFPAPPNLEGKSKEQRESDMRSWKKDCVDTVYSSPAWKHYDAARRRYNPWHENLDNSMFWM